MSGTSAELPCRSCLCPRRTARPRQLGCTVDAGRGRSQLPAHRLVTLGTVLRRHRRLVAAKWRRQRARTDAYLGAVHPGHQPLVAGRPRLVRVHQHDHHLEPALTAAPTGSTTSTSSPLTRPSLPTIRRRRLRRPASGTPIRVTPWARHSASPSGRAPATSASSSSVPTVPFPWPKSSSWLRKAAPPHDERQRVKPRSTA